MPFPKGQKTETKSQEEQITEEDSKKESTQLKKTKRSREDIKNLFKESYLKKNGIDLSDPKMKEAGLDKKLDTLLDGLTDRELSNSRNMSKVIGQKIKFREELKDKSSESKEEKTEEETKSTDGSLEALKNIERKKAIKKFLPRIVKEFKDEGLSEEDVYNKLDKFYAEEDEDVRREDFTENLKQAFRAAYPDLYEERIKRDEAKGNDSDSPIIGGGSHQIKTKKKVDKSNLSQRGSRKIENLRDWFKDN